MSVDNNIDFKDHIVEYPNRFKQTTVAPGIIELVPTWIETPEQIIQPGTPVDSELFKKLKQNVTIYQQTFTTTNNQTVINLDRDFLVGQNRVSLSIGGVRQYAGQDYTETDSHTLTMTAPLKGGLKGEVIMFTASQVIAEDFFEKTLEAITATQAANDAAQDAFDAAMQANNSILNWRTPIDAFSQLASVSSPKNLDTVMVRETGKVFRYNGTTWLEIQDVDPTAINALDTRLSGQLKDFAKFSTSPLYVETLVGFGWMGIGTPLNITNYTGGNFVLGVNGVAGDNFFTVVSGNINDAGPTTTWAAVLEKVSLDYEGYRVTGTDGLSRIYVYPNVRETVTGATLGNLHDSSQGQHYTRLGYKAFGQHIFNQSGFYAQRSRYLTRFLGTDTESQWTNVGTITGITYNWGLNLINTDGLLVSDFNRALTYDTSASGAGMEWEITTDKSKGYFEGFISAYSGGSITVEFYVDGVLKKSTIIDRGIKRLLFDYSYGTVAKVRIISNSATATKVRIGNCYWWVSSPVSTNVFDGKSKAVYLGDSWGTYHDGANPKEIERLWKKKKPDAAVVNRSQGGMTSKWGRMWFNDYVLANKPDIVIIEFFTNDSNTIVNPANGTSFVGPDGQSYNTAVTESEYHENIRWMTDTAISNGILPIVIMPSVVATQTQTQYHAIRASVLANGANVVPSNATFKTLTAVTTTTNEVLADKMKVKTSINKALEVLVNTFGMEVKPTVTMYGGKLLKLINNNGIEVMSLTIDDYGSGGILNVKAFNLSATPFNLLPTANASNRGKVYRVEGGTGVADKFYTCAKNSSDSYEWREL